MCIVPAGRALFKDTIVGFGFKFPPKVFGEFVEGDGEGEVVG